MKPRIIILDEPTTGQDYLGCLQVMQIVKDLHKRGHTIIIVTHHMPLVAEYTERTIVLCKGELLLDGPTSEVFAKPDILQKTYITPPQITQLAQRISKKMGISSRALSVEELGEDILAFLNSKQKSAVVP
jgi:energy-coupling factor transport system ATP-binding protein